jgi:hypothetical protein
MPRADVRLDRWEPLRGGDRFKVWRAHLHEGAAAAPETVVVKTAVASAGAGCDPDATDTGAAWRLFNEWASLELLARLAAENPLTPGLYGGDRTAGVIVIEDLRASVGLESGVALVVHRSAH